MMSWIFWKRFNWFDALMIIASVHISIDCGLLIGLVFMFCAGIISTAGEMQWASK